MSLSKKQRDYIATHTSANLQTVSAGHMLYHRLVSDEKNGWFIKAYDELLFTNPFKQREAKKYLEKEAAVYSHLRKHSFTHIPNKHSYKHGTLILSAHHERDGWLWRAPKDNTLSAYIQDCLQAFALLETLPYDEQLDGDTTLDYLWYNSWGSKESLADSLDKSVKHWSHKLTERNVLTARRLATHHTKYRIDSMPSPSSGISHHDARQSNIAWHPAYGSKIVDWSWASPGLKNSDATMLLIDLHKSGHSVRDYLEYFNSTYASLMMYYWILRHGAESAQGNDIVRLHQLLSALAAFELLELAAGPKARV